jgi:hypothetical protein
MAQSYLNAPLRPHYTLCKVEGEDPTKWFRQIGRDGGEHCRIAEADLVGKKTIERGRLVKSSNVGNRRRVEDMAVTPPRLPLERVQRLDRQVDQFVKDRAAPGETFNDALRRLLAVPAVPATI